MHTLVMDLEPGYIGTEPGFLYRFNRDLWQTITSSHLTLQTKQGRIKNFKLSGVTRQVETTGAQLLDVNQIPKGTEGGATLDIVDDQIIISGSGALTSTFGRSKKLTHEETMQLIGDNRTFTLSVTQYINPPAFVNFADASKNLMTLSTLTATSITRTIPENMDMDTLYIYYGVSNIAGAEIVPGTARVMLNAGDTALPWEPLPAISQQALRNLPTYKGTTIIDTTDPLQPEITVSYRAAKKNFFNPEKVFNSPVEATGYYKFDLGLSPGNYRWSIQKNEFLGSGQSVLITDALDYYGSNYIEGKTYNWVGHDTLTKFCFTSGIFTVKDVMYIASAFKTDMEAVKQLLKTLIIEKV